MNIKKIFKILLILFLSAVCSLCFLTSIWKSINKFYHYPVPKLLWTLEDIPKLPPETQNGWTQIRQAWDKDPNTFEVKPISEGV